MHPLELKLIWNFPSLTPNLYTPPLIHISILASAWLRSRRSRSRYMLMVGMATCRASLFSWRADEKKIDLTLYPLRKGVVSTSLFVRREAISATIATSSCFNNIIKTTSTTTSESLANGSGLLLRYAHPIITLWRSTHHQLSPLGHHYTDDKMQNKETNNHQPSLLKRALLCVNACLLASLSYAWSISIHHSVLSCQFSWIILCIRLSYWGPAHIWTGTLGAYSL